MFFGFSGKIKIIDLKCVVDIYLRGSEKSFVIWRCIY